MKNVALYLKRNFYFILSIITVFLTVVFAGVLFFVLDLSKDVSQTSVGFVYLGGTEESAYADVLSPRIQQWQNTADYTLSYQSYVWDIDLTHFVFETEITVANIKQNRNNLAFFSLSDAHREALFEDITDDLTTHLVDYFDFHQFVIDLEKDMQSLKNRKRYNLTAYLDASVESFIIDTVDMSSLKNSVVLEITSQITELTIPGNQRFYLIKALASYNLSNEAHSVMASALQYLTVKTPVEGYIYQMHDVNPTWAELGMNARILKLNGYDFSFFNPLKENMTLEIEQLDDQTIRFILRGYPFLTTYERITVVGPTLYFKTLITDNPLLNELTEGVLITETDTSFIYELVLVPGIQGSITYMHRRVTPLDGLTYDVALFYEQVLPRDQVIEQHIVAKG
jgi:hypothetical protein